MNRIFLLLIFLCSLTGLPPSECRAEFSGTPQTGLLLLEKKHPYHLFVPPEYSPDKSWPLVIVLIGGLKDEKKGIEPWVDWAKKNQLLALFPGVLPREGGASTEEVDRWILGIKKEVLERYHVGPHQILLVGIELGGHYAAYLGLNYPGEFSAVALFRQAWAGPFEKLMKPSADHEKQVSFYVAVDPASPSFRAVEAKAIELEKKGYSLQRDSLKETEDFLGIRDRVIRWFLEDTEIRVVRVKGKRKSGWRGKFQEIRKNLFEF